jgi:hypothetical protein
MSDENSPRPVQGPSPPSTPKMVLPSPAPQSEGEGLQAGGQFQYSPNPIPGGSEQGATRIPGDATRHPINKQWTKSPNPRSR